MSCISEMPQNVQNEYNRAVRERKPEKWLNIVRLAITEGVMDPNKLADIPFYLDRPELMNRALKSHETTLVRAWFTTRDNLIPYVEAVRRNTADPDLTHWLELLDTSWIKPRTEHADAQTNRLRQKALERLRVFMAKASAAPHEYDTVYRQYKYHDGLGRARSASERTHQVDSFKRVGAQNALIVLQNGVNKLDGEFRKFHLIFADLEFAVFANTDVVCRWVLGGATNDGPTESTQMETQLNWLASQARRPKSIYSVYRSSLLGAHKAFNDESPRTAGLFSGFGSWEDWKDVW